MGIKGLTAVINEHAPDAIKQTEMKTLFGRRIAIDASMSIYQFLIAVRQQDGQQLQNEAGETTSHLMGIFYRTIRMVDNGIKVVYVFDGKPPDLKKGVLAKRYAKRTEATDAGEEAKETGTIEDMDRASRRTVKVTKEHNEECRRLLDLMGVPWAPSEAEAQCAELCRGGLVYGTGSEDMDTLTFASPVLLRHLTFSEARKLPIDIIKLDDVLKGLEMNMSEFIDFCILCGCDYLEPLKKVGGKTALKYIKDHKNLEGVLQHLRSKKNKDGEIANPPPEEWPFEQARILFQKPDVIPAKEIDLKWKDPDVDGLIEFMVNEKGFDETRIRKGADKLKMALTAKQQNRLDGFFKMAPKSDASSDPVNPARTKRLAEEARLKEEEKAAKKLKREEAKRKRKETVAAKKAEKAEAAENGEESEDSKPKKKKAKKSAPTVAESDMSED